MSSSRKKTARPKPKAKAKAKARKSPRPSPAREAELLGKESDASDSEADLDLDGELEKGISPEDIRMGVIVDSDADPSENWLQLYQKEENRPALSPSDPLRRYLEDISRYPLLSLEEELALAKRMIEDGDMNAARMLVQANLRLVVKIAFEYRSIYHNVLDLIQEGNVGLMKAVSRFDPTKGAKLSYYSSWWIKSYILKYILDNFRLVKIGTTQAQKKLFYHLMREKQRLEAQGLQAGPKLLADKLNVKESEVEEMSLRLSGGGAEASIDTPLRVGGDGESRSSFKDLLESDSESADELLAHQEALDILRSRLPAFKKTLSDKEQKVLDNRILSEDPKTLQEIADLYGLTRERVRQIENTVVVKLRDFLKGSLVSD